MMNSVIPNQLARSCRPGYPSKQVPAADVETTVAEWQSAGIRSVICLLDDVQLAYYKSLPEGLLGTYDRQGFAVLHVPVRDHKVPALDAAETAAVLSAYAELPKPVLIHCSAGIDRTGAAVRALVSPDAFGIRPVDNVPESEHPRNQARPNPPANALFAVEPYRDNGNWYLDDPSVGLVREPFVEGVPEMIDQLIAALPGSPDRFRLIFSSKAFPGAQHCLRLDEEAFDGGWYTLEPLGLRGWLCPALLKYYPAPPTEIHLKMEGVR